MSGIAEGERRPHRNFNLRAYLAGGAATGAMVAAAIVLFGSLAAYVAFNGLPIGGQGEGSSRVVVEAGADAPKLAAAALSKAPRAVAASPAAQTAVAPRPGANRAGGKAAPEATAGAGLVAGTDAETGAGTDTDTVTGGDPTTVGGGQAPSGESPTTASGPLGSTVDQVDNTTGLPLGGATDPITGPVDDALQNVGNALGGNGLAGGLGAGLDGATGGLLGNP